MLIELENLFENEGERLLIDQSFDFSGEELNGVRPFVSPVKVKGEVRNRAGIVSLHARAAFVFSAPCDAVRRKPAGHAGASGACAGDAS